MDVPAWRGAGLGGLSGFFQLHDSSASKTSRSPKCHVAIRHDFNQEKGLFAGFPGASVLKTGGDLSRLPRRYLGHDRQHFCSTAVPSWGGPQPPSPPGKMLHSLSGQAAGSPPWLWAPPAPSWAPEAISPAFRLRSRPSGVLVLTRHLSLPSSSLFLPHRPHCHRRFPGSRRSSSFPVTYILRS